MELVDWENAMKVAYIVTMIFAAFIIPMVIKHYREMNPIDRIIFEMKGEAKAHFERINHSTQRIEEIEEQANRVGLKVDWERQQLVPIMEKEKNVIITRLQAVNN